MGLMQYIIASEKTQEELNSLDKIDFFNDFENFMETFEEQMKEQEVIKHFRKYGIFHNYMQSNYKENIMFKYIKINKQDAEDFLTILDEHIENNNNKMNFFLNYALYKEQNEKIVREICNLVIQNTDKNYYYYAML